MSKSIRILLGILSGLLFIGLIALLKNVDVAPIAAGDTKVGLSSLNQSARSFFGEQTVWHTITDWLGYCTLLIGGCFALTGLIQLIRRRSLLKIDREIIALGVLYILTLIVYIVFEKVVINCRPLLLPKDLEPAASFPSSHTVMSLVILLSTAMLIPRYAGSVVTARIIQVLCGLLAAVAVIGRLISGVHWLTDILGGLLISACLLFFFSAYLHRNDIEDDNLQ